MADFYQNGVVTTLHNLASRSTEALEAELLRFSQKRPELSLQSTRVHFALVSTFPVPR